MPEALATSKRKFYKLIDTLSGPTRSTPTAQPAPVPATSAVVPSAIEPSFKRQRSDPGSALSSLRARNSSSISIASLRHKKPAATPATPITTKDLPQFSPWSHETFLSRLKTFAPVSLWHPKPDAVGEVEWAKRGWVCVDTNTVGCKGGCGRRIVVDVAPRVRGRTAGDADGEDGLVAADGAEDEEEMDDAFELGLVQKYSALIVDGHAESCLWRQAGCKADIYRLPIVRSAVWQHELRERYCSLVDEAILPSIEKVLLKPLDASPGPDKLVADLPPSLLISPSSSQQEAIETADLSHHDTLHKKHVRKQALTMALCGWKGNMDARTALLACDTCFQRIGLWMYQPDYKRPHQASTDDDDDDQEDNRLLDAVEMHRQHCPWRNGASQCATGDFAGLPAWQILWRTVARYADEHRRRSRDRALLAQAESPAVGDGIVPDAATSAEGEADMASLAESPMPELSRAETEKMDKERVTKLRRLKRVLGLTRKVPPAQ